MSEQRSSWQARAEAQGTAAHRLVCVVGECNETRQDGRLYCPGHGPAELTRWERDAVARQAGHAVGRAAIVCPHCHVQGHVSTQPVKVKRGISGGKAAGALLTAGVSVLATGLSWKEAVTECSCGNCGITWHV